MVWYNLFIIILLTLGNAWLIVGIINRLHAMPWSCRTLKRIRYLHDLAIPLFPVLLVWFVGISGPAVLSGGSWQKLSWGWAIYLSFCLIGLIQFISCVIRWNFRPSPSLQLSNHTHCIDVAQQLGHKPIGVGPLANIARLPGNQIFEVEFIEKHIVHPALPADWNGLKLLHLTDFHFMGTIHKEFYRFVCEHAAQSEPDLIVFTGDLMEATQYCDWIADTLGTLAARLGNFYILGNHDGYLSTDPIRNRLNEIGWKDVSSTIMSIELAGKRLTIAGTEVPWMGQHPDMELTVEADFRLLLSHTPDHFEWAQFQRVDLMLSGHNHGGQIVLPMIGPLYCPSRFGVRYASGLYWQDPTLMYVSRGLAGMHPIRWNCRPEITTISLSSPPE